MKRGGIVTGRRRKKWVSGPHVPYSAADESMTNKNAEWVGSPLVPSWLISQQHNPSLSMYSPGPKSILAEVFLRMARLRQNGRMRTDLLLYLS